MVCKINNDFFRFFILNKVLNSSKFVDKKIEKKLGNNREKKRILRKARVELCTQFLNSEHRSVLVLRMWIFKMVLMTWIVAISTGRQRQTSENKTKSCKKNLAEMREGKWRRWKEKKSKRTAKSEDCRQTKCNYRTNNCARL